MGGRCEGEGSNTTPCPVSVVRMVRVDPENKPNLVKLQPSNVPPQTIFIKMRTKIVNNINYNPSEEFSNSDHVLSYIVVDPGLTRPLKILKIFPSHCIKIEV